MCLAIPAKIESLEEGKTARATVLGVTRVVALDLVPHATVGDFVLVHAGYAIEVIDEVMAEETLDLIREFPELVEGA